MNVLLLKNYSQFSSQWLIEQYSEKSVIIRIVLRRYQNLSDSFYTVSFKLYLITKLIILYEKGPQTTFLKFICNIIVI